MPPETYLIPTSEMVHIWSDQNRRQIIHQIWAAVLEFHIDHGVVDPSWRWVVDALRWRQGKIDLWELEKRERTTRHDIKALLEQTIDEIGCDQILHLGMTSADVVDNATQVQMAQTMSLLASRHQNPTLVNWPGWYPFRGIKGAVGTHQDQMDLLGTADLCTRLDLAIAQQFGFTKVMNSVGQTGMRSTDLQVASAVAVGISSRPAQILAAGYLQMVAQYAGDTWNEGDVSSSVVRRVALPGLALAADMDPVR